MRTIRIKLYKFGELTEAAKKKAIHEHQEFLADISLSNGENYADLEDSEIIDEIEANEYCFFEDGELAHCTTYTGEHPKSGKTEFHFHGRNYSI